MSNHRPTTCPFSGWSNSGRVSSFSGLRFLVFNMGDTLCPASPQGCLRDHDTTGVCECFVGLGATENQRKTRRWCDCRAVLGIRGGFYLQKWLRVFWELLPLALREERILRWGADAGGFAGSDAEIHSLEGKQTGRGCGRSWDVTVGGSDAEGARQSCRRQREGPCADRPLHAGFPGEGAWAPTGDRGGRPPPAAFPASVRVHRSWRGFWVWNIL